MRLAFVRCPAALQQFLRFLTPAKTFFVRERESSSVFCSASFSLLRVIPILAAEILPASPKISRVGIAAMIFDLDMSCIAVVTSVVGHRRAAGIGRRNELENIFQKILTIINPDLKK